MEIEEVVKQLQGLGYREARWGETSNDYNLYLTNVISDPPHTVFGVYVDFHYVGQFQYKYRFHGDVERFYVNLYCGTAATMSEQWSLVEDGVDLYQLLTLY